MSMIPDLESMTDEQKLQVLESIQKSIRESKEIQKKKVGENVQAVLTALRKIETDVTARFDSVAKTIETRVANIKDGRDGAPGADGRPGRDGKDGRPGRDGKDGKDGMPGRDGVPGMDGVSVVSAFLDFDNSLIIELSNGQQINAGEVLPPDIAEKLKVVVNTSTGGVGLPEQTGNSGKFLTTDGTNLSWGDIAGGLDYQGTWNAATNTPTLASGVGVNGYYYVVSVAGSTNLNGVTDWQPGDWVIFNGTAWQKIDQSWATAGVNNNITAMTGITGGISSPDFIQFDTAATVTDATGKLYYDSSDMYETLAFQMNNSVIQHIGEELYYRVRLSANATKGQVLMFTGTLGSSGGLTAAPATGLTAEQAPYILGICADTGVTNDWVTVYSFGEIKGVNTSAFTQGQVLYYDPTTAGGLTATKPAVPNAIVLVAAVVHVGTSNGILFVRPTYGSVLGGTDGNVRFTSLASGNTIIYDAVDGVWKNANLTDGTGITITEGAGSITITNSAPDQTVSLTGAGTTSVSGTYPNFTITSNDQYTGTVTSVGGAGTVNGITLSGTVTSSGSLTLGGALTGVDLTTQVTGTLPIANGGTGQTTQTAAFDALSPLTTKGDLVVNNGTNDVRLAVGTNGYLLTADSTAAEGVKWAAAPVSTTVADDTTTNATYYPTFSTATSGTFSVATVSSTKYTYNPSLGTLTAMQVAASNGLILNKNVVATSFTLPTDYNAMSTGPISVNSGVTVTVPSGQVWTIV